MHMYECVCTCVYVGIRVCTHVHVQRRYDTMTSREIIADCAVTSQWRFSYILAKLIAPQRNVKFHFLVYIRAFN